MKRMGLCAMLLGCALLCACGAAPSAGQNLQEQYAAVKTAQLEAEVVCHLEGESRSYTVQCSYDRGGDAVTTITTPEELAGISATVSGSDLTLTYDGTGLAAGPLRDVCAANCLPLLLRAVSDGYILEQGKETIEGQPCLRPVMTLKTTVSTIKTYPPDTCVSYGRLFRTTRTTRMGVVPVGYADGLMRCLSDRFSMMTPDGPAPQRGRICMDMCMIDLTDLPEVQVGDEVEIFGPENSIDKLAEIGGTIPYELSCAVSKRVPRVYRRSGEVVGRELLLRF